MKIDFIIADLKGGGAQRVMVILANNFVKLGFEVKLITFNPGMAYTLDRDIELVNLHKSSIKNHTLRSIISIVKYYRKKNRRPDIIISFITQLNLKAIIAAKIYNIKIIASEHNSHLRAQKPIFITNFTRNFLYPKLDYLTVLTAYDIPYYSKKNIKTVVVPNPCTFNSLPNRGANREKVILAVGDLDRYHHKGFDNLITLIAPILKQNPDWKLKIIGGGDIGLKYLSELVSTFGLTEQILFLGFCRNVSDIMAKSEVFILSSRYEGLPMVLLEAMSQGMACISYDCISGPADIINNNYSGILIEDQNKVEMQAKLNELLNNDELRQSLGENALSSLGKFSLENVSKEWITLFKNLNLLPC